MIEINEQELTFTLLNIREPESHEKSLFTFTQKGVYLDFKCNENEEVGILTLYHSNDSVDSKEEIRDMLISSYSSAMAHLNRYKPEVGDIL